MTQQTVFDNAIDTVIANTRNSLYRDKAAAELAALREQNVALVDALVHFVDMTLGPDFEPTEANKAFQSIAQAANVDSWTHAINVAHAALAQARGTDSEEVAK